MDYKATLNLPETAFPMKADLTKKEPEILSRWETGKLYDQILAARRGAPIWVLHDGPPYANGHIHYGHILNKILKDVVCKFRTMAGHYVEYKPGWDCHGLPIELAVMRENADQAAKMSPVDIRKACNAYAMKWVGTQRDEFKRLGVFGTWDQPYLTLSREYEATIVRQLAEFARNGLLFRDLKPVHWCTSDKTALAEAEIEYDDAHVSPSIYVKFALPSEPGTFAVIWTTTPWTLPANWAIAYHPEFQYVTVAANGERYIVAEKLADAFVQACKLTESGPRTPFPTARFAELRAARHPFLDRDSLLLPAEYVTLEQGTGLVHTAPGHGADDYQLGKKHGLPVHAPVDDSGRFTEGPWQGKPVFAANPEIVELLHAKGVLLSPPDARVTHSYPICWRCKKPVIFRATWQWFARMDKHEGARVDLRKVALEEIARTDWIPPWGENRITGMIANRPDWVLSRQRVWGVPIPVLVKGDEFLVDAEVMERIASLFAREGADIWFEWSVEQMLGPEYKDWDKGRDIVDVWFESGVSWAAVCENREGLDSRTIDDARPIDLYLEGSDQHRGWFHSSLLAACATRGHAPYRAVLTHGFVLDDRGKPYSKSEIEKARREGKKVEYIPPEEVLKTQGAELLRLWVAQADFRNDVAYSRAHLVQLGEAYRKIRNTARFLLGNLRDFDPAAARVPATDLLDRYVEERVAEFEARILEAYEHYEFHVVFKLIQELCTNELSSLYLDIRKDRLYCDRKDAPERRATQAVLYRALRALVTAMAPVFCFTADEIWSHMTRRLEDPASVHLALLPKGSLSTAQASTKDEIAPHLELRARVQKELEAFRAQKKSSLDAHVTLSVSGDEAARIGTLPQGWLADFLIVSQVTVKLGDPATVVTDAGGHRCERCWKWQDQAPLCARCQAAIGGRS
jgi:isoleucyl-tRNA synthetase